MADNIIFEVDVKGVVYRINKKLIDDYMTDEIQSIARRRGLRRGENLKGCPDKAIEAAAVELARQLREGPDE